MWEVSLVRGRHPKRSWRLDEWGRTLPQLSKPGCIWLLLCAIVRWGQTSRMDARYLPGWPHGRPWIFLLSQAELVPGVLQCKIQSLCHVPRGEWESGYIHSTGVLYCSSLGACADALDPSCGLHSGEADKPTFTDECVRKQWAKAAHQDKGLPLWTTTAERTAWAFHLVSRSKLYNGLVVGQCEHNCLYSIAMQVMVTISNHPPSQDNLLESHARVGPTFHIYACKPGWEALFSKSRDDTAFSEHCSRLHVEPTMAAPGSQRHRLNWVDYIWFTPGGRLKYRGPCTSHIHENSSDYRHHTWLYNHCTRV